MAVPLVAAEFRQLLQALDIRSPFGPRDYFMLVFVHHTGLRISELVGLNVERVAYRGQPRPTLTVPRSLGKGGKARRVPLNPVAQKAVSKLLEFNRKRGFSVEPSAPLLVNRYHERVTVRSVQRFMVALRQKAGLDIPASIHSIRHLFATQLTKACGNPRITQEVLGHHRLQTLELYTHPAHEDLADAVSLMARPRAS